MMERGCSDRNRGLYYADALKRLRLRGREYKALTGGLQYQHLFIESEKLGFVTPFEYGYFTTFFRLSHTLRLHIRYALLPTESY